MTTTNTPTDTRRQALAAGLHALADFLAEHPDVPADGGGTVGYCVFADSDQAGIERVAEIAAALGVEVTDIGGGNPTAGTTHFLARRRFGPAVYEASYITNAWMADYDAHMSYRGNVRADEEQEASA
ncbi:hypothetical protein ODJ79_12685 [Actinoplanes sp. KI2]|uniref:hypothetical protein n=1 Tax=Actinoplanes sp. KI2 TaxID=2983315 RepID=UPI0021D5BEB6|nr:hypothetical protein [Actinoplanes sp. KI2]MCU7724576.1 hypothetical protein [Actinoplanes sp. KI2]